MRERSRLTAIRYAGSAGLVIGVVLCAVFVSGIPRPVWPAILGLPLALGSWKVLEWVAESLREERRSDPTERTRTHARDIRGGRRRR